MNTFCVFSVSAPTSERVCWMYSTVFMRRIQTRLTFFHECINLYFENICRRWLMNHSDILFIFYVIFCSLLLKAKCFVQILQAMIQMGVLVPTGDMTAVRRTAKFFLNRWSPVQDKLLDFFSFSRFSSLLVGALFFCSLLVCQSTQS